MGNYIEYLKDFDNNIITKRNKERIANLPQELKPEIYNFSGMSGIGGVGSLIYKELLLYGYDVPWIDALEDN